MYCNCGAFLEEEGEDEHDCPLDGVLEDEEEDDAEVEGP
jgi:hypothetical protein